MMFRLIIGVVMAMVGFIVAILGLYKHYDDELSLVVALLMLVIGVTLTIVGIVVVRLAWIAILANTLTNTLPTVVGIIH